ncbi:hypothetical protein TIFTF001_037092 [Ficus carica]|uniref:Secreted protein n=1 Tax=Ficus carica TaxID=3494 RepID=A0AA88E5I4_FICCA|nr:hypothetical protein TIFTF001_037092 [Ficus carica]
MRTCLLLASMLMRISGTTIPVNRITAAAPMATPNPAPNLLAVANLSWSLSQSSGVSSPAFQNVTPQFSALRGNYPPPPASATVRLVMSKVIPSNGVPFFAYGDSDSGSMAATCSIRRH